MKQLLILLLFFATQLQSQTLDSIFLKTGNIVTGKFIFAPTREYIHTASDYSKRIMANTTTKIVVDKVTYYTIPYLKKDRKSVV